MATHPARRVPILQGHGWSVFRSSVGKIIHGDDYRTLKVKVAPLLSRARKLATSVTELVGGGSPPDMVLNRHCGDCEFREACRMQAIAKDDLSLLSNMTGQERRTFRDQGIFTVTQLSYTFRPRRRPRLLRDMPEKYLPWTGPVSLWD